MKYSGRVTRSLLLFSVATFSVVQLAAAANDTWTGGNSATDNNWTDGVNWGGTAPLAGDSLFFDGNAGVINTNNYPAGTFFNGITFNPAASAFTIYGSNTVLSGSTASTTN